MADPARAGTTGYPRSLGGAGYVRRAASTGNAVHQAAQLRKIKRAEQIRENYRQGKAAEEECLAILRSEGRNVRASTQGVKTPYGLRKPDIEELDANNIIIRFIEVKSGRARKSAAQSKKDDWISKAFGIPTVVHRMP